MTTEIKIIIRKGVMEVEFDEEKFTKEQLVALLETAIDLLKY